MSEQTLADAVVEIQGQFFYGKISWVDGVIIAASRGNREAMIELERIVADEPKREIPLTIGLIVAKAFSDEFSRVGLINKFPNWDYASNFIDAVQEQIYHAIDEYPKSEQILARMMMDVDYDPKEHPLNENLIPMMQKARHQIVHRHWKMLGMDFNPIGLDLNSR